MFAVIVALMPRLMTRTPRAVAARWRSSIHRAVAPALRDTIAPEPSRRARASAGADAPWRHGVQRGDARARARARHGTPAGVPPRGAPARRTSPPRKRWLTAPPRTARGRWRSWSSAPTPWSRRRQELRQLRPVRPAQHRRARRERAARQPARGDRQARLARRQLDARDVEVMTAVPRGRRSPSATSSGRRPRLQPLVPFVFVGLLVFGVMIGAQTLMTSTVEEKSSRVIEVLLSAVSPFELMAGKVLGQMAVSLLVLALYVGIGVLMLSSFAMLGLLDPWLIVYLVIFFLITYFLFASVFGAIGPLVTEMREAQALVTPVMLVLMLPWLLAAPVARDPTLRWPSRSVSFRR
jgi:hypothetical protein